MSIASRIEAIEEHIGDIYDTLEVGGVDLTNVDKNIVNINSNLKERLIYYMNNGLDVVWENWEKVVGTGTALTLNQTLNAPMKIELKGNTYQYSTTGKNLFDKSTVTNNKLVSRTNGELSSNNSYKASDYIPVKANITYTQSNCNHYYSVYYDTNKEYVGICGTKTFTPSQDGYIRTTIANADIDTAMVEVGSTATSYEPYTNGASPNPDYPQDIHIVTGDNEIKVEGKNLLPNTNEGQTLNYVTFTRNSDGSVKANGTASANTFFNCGDTTLQAGTYKLSSTTTCTTKSYLQLIEVTTGNPVITTLSNTSSATFTISEEKNIRVYWRISSGEIISNVTLYPMIEKGNQATPYEPYQSASYPINLPEGMELCKIGDYQDRIFKTSGKNLIDISTVYSYTIYTGSSTISPTSDRYAYLVEAKPNTTYTFSRSAVGSASLSYLVLLDNFIDGENNTYTSATNVGSNLTQTITTGANTKYVMFLSGSGESTNIMLNEGSTALPYEPYGKVWYIEKKIGKAVLDGSEDWNYGSNTQALYTNLTDYKQEEAITCKCNYYIAQENVTTAYNILDKRVCLRISTTPYLYIKDSTFNNASDFQTWLSTHNTTVYYVLNTSTNTQITDTDLIEQLNALEGARSYNNQTNISQENNDIPFIVDVITLKNI